jgi:hypothetical protein
MKILPNTQRLGKLTFDSNQVKKSKTNPNVLIAKASDGKDYGVVRKSDGSYDYAGSSRNATFGDRMATASANPNIGTRLLETVGLLTSEPQRIMTRALTNNRYNNPEEVVADSKLPNGMLKNTLGFAAGMLADPTNLVGAGIGAKLVKNSSKILSNTNKAKSSIFSKLKSVLDNYNPLNVDSESSVDWMKDWYSDPDFVRRYEANKSSSADIMQPHILSQLNQYQPKNYLDLLKDKGLKSYLQLAPISRGVSYGTPKGIYHNGMSYAPFNMKGIESVKAHELTHLIERNGDLLTSFDEASLLKPFNISSKREIPKNPGTLKTLLGDNPEYFLDPTEIHARVNQARFDLGLKPKDIFTEKMYNKISRNEDWYGMGRYIKNKPEMIKLMNNFWGTLPVGVGLGAAASTMSNKDKNNKFKYGGKLLPLLNKF